MRLILQFPLLKNMKSMFADLDWFAKQGIWVISSSMSGNEENVLKHFYCQTPTQRITTQLQPNLGWLTLFPPVTNKLTKTRPHQN